MTNTRIVPEALLTGMPVIDAEHAALMESLQRLHKAPTDDVHSEPFLEVISQLGQQLIEHFANEEKTLHARGLPEADVVSHLRAHDAILEQYAQLQDDLMHDRGLQQSSVLTMIQHWIMTHVATHDLKIGQYLAG